MQYTTLGSSGLKISRIALGCMSFGDTSRGFNEWALDDTAAEPLFRQAVELGITFWDTANAYGYGTSEEIVGRAIRTYARREEVVLATKVYFTMHDGPGGSGLSRRAIIEQLDDSLRRLGTDYVDLYQIHRFDPGTPVEETMEALYDSARKSARCSACWPTSASDRFRGARPEKGGSLARGDSRPRAATPTLSPAGCCRTTIRPSRTPSSRWRDSTACRWRRSRWRGCYATR